MKPILYYAKGCPDTKPFVDRLNELGIVYVFKRFKTVFICKRYL